MTATTTSNDHHRCSQTVYSGARWDFGGHPCGNRATSQSDDGRWWCRRHHPDVRATRNAARDMIETEARDEFKRAETDLKDLIERACIDGAYPTRRVWDKFGAAPTGVFIPTAQFRVVVDRITGTDDVHAYHARIQALRAERAALEETP